MIHLNYPIICFVGPTASGKTALAQSYAEHVGGEIISADSMQIYKGMDIGTGKILQKDRTVPYHILDIVEPGQSYSAAAFQKDARRAIAIINSKSKPVIIAGGTGFYIRAAIDDYVFPSGERENNPVRDMYEDIYHDEGALNLWRRLKNVDPASASCLHHNDVKKVIRALELYDSGESYANLLQNISKIPQLYESIFIGLKVDREVLYRRINDRVDAMIDEGLIYEVNHLLERGFENGLTSPQAIGYKEIVEYLNGEIDLDSALNSVKQASRRYAKRQMTWFNKDKRINWIDATNSSLDIQLKQTLDIIDSVN